MYTNVLRGNNSGQAVPEVHLLRTAQCFPHLVDRWPSTLPRGVDIHLKYLELEAPHRSHASHETICLIGRVRSLYTQPMMGSQSVAGRMYRWLVGHCRRGV